MRKQTLLKYFKMNQTKERIRDDDYNSFLMCSHFGGNVEKFHRKTSNLMSSSTGFGKEWLHFHKLTTKNIFIHQGVFITFPGLLRLADRQNWRQLKNVFPTSSLVFSLQMRSLRAIINIHLNGGCVAILEINKAPTFFLPPIYTCGGYICTLLVQPIYDFASQPLLSSQF